MQPQIDKLQRGVDILVATPGRLLDHHGQRTLDLSHVEILVLDEADRMLDMGFIPDIKQVLALLPAKRQNLLFSATFSRRDQGARRPPARTRRRLIEVAPPQLDRRARSRRSVHPVDRERRSARCSSHLIKTQRLAPGAGVHAHQARRQQAGRAPAEADGIAAMAIHGNKSQTRAHQGARRLQERRRCRCWSRPTSPRAASTSTSCRTSSTSSCRTCPRTTCTASAAPAAPAPTGEAISLVCVDENGFLRDIERLIKHEIPKEIDRRLRAAGARAARADRPRPHGDRRRRRPRRRAAAPRRAQPRPRRARPRAQQHERSERRTRPQRAAWRESRARQRRASAPPRPPGAGTAPRRSARRGVAPADDAQALSTRSSPWQPPPTPRAARSSPGRAG